MSDEPLPQSEIILYRVRSHRDTQAFPNYDALRHELSWTHYRLLLVLTPPPPASGI